MTVAELRHIMRNALDDDTVVVYDWGTGETIDVHAVVNRQPGTGENTLTVIYPTNEE